MESTTEAEAEASAKIYLTSSTLLGAIRLPEICSKYIQPKPARINYEFMKVGTIYIKVPIIIPWAGSRSANRVPKTGQQAVVIE